VSPSSASLSAIRRKVESRERITPADALLLWREATDEEMRSLATQVRTRFHAPNSCTYLLMRIINTTNVCVAQCDYCAFYTLPGQPGGYVLTEAQIFAKIDELLALGGDLIGFNGGFNPQLSIDHYCNLVRAIRARFGDRIELYAFTIAEFLYLADHASLSYAAAARRLKQAGVRWITGGGSEILTEDFRRRHSKFKYTVAQFFRGADGHRRRRTAHHRNDGDRFRRDRSKSASSTSTAPAAFRTRPAVRRAFSAGTSSPGPPRSARNSTTSRSPRPSTCATSP
jgi:cyclic dehypoxanthinyl futalosine synthase